MALEPGRFQAASRWLRLSLRGEAVFGVAVMLSVALLTATPPPAPANARAQAMLPTFTATEGDLTLTLTANPGAVGTNSYDVRLMRGSDPVIGAQVTMQLIFPALGRRYAPIVLDEAGDGLYVSAGAELTRPGAWQVVFDAMPGGPTKPIRLALDWNVSAQADQGTGRQPGFLNWLSLFGVVGVIGWWSVPPLRCRLRLLNLDPQAVAVGIGASILTVIVLIGGAFYLANATRAFDDASNLVPTYINSVLPDSTSLRNGRTAFEANCQSCHVELKAMMPYVTSRNDSELYAFLLGTTKHSHGDRLSEGERWSVINYLRAATQAP